MTITFEIELKTKPESLDQWDLIMDNEDEIIFELEDELARGGDDNDWNLLLDLCEILGRDFDDLDLKDDNGQHCDFLWADRKRELLRDVACDHTVVQVDGKHLICTAGGSND